MDTDLVMMTTRPHLLSAMAQRLGVRSTHLEHISTRALRAGVLSIEGIGGSRMRQYEYEDEELYVIDDIVYEFLRHQSIYELSTSRNVSSQFRRVVDRRILPAITEVGQFDIDESIPLDVLRRLTNLRKLHVGWATHLTDETLAHYVNLTHLTLGHNTKLTLYGTSEEPSGPWLPTLVYLNTGRNTNINDRAIKRLPYLTTLIAEYGSWITLKSIQPLASQLVDFRYHAGEFNRDALEGMRDIIHQFTSLRTLRVHPRIAMADFYRKRHFASLVSLAHLTDLDLINANITDASLSPLTRLRRVNIKSPQNMVTKQGIANMHGLVHLLIDKPAYLAGTKTLSRLKYLEIEMPHRKLDQQNVDDAPGLTSIICDGINPGVSLRTLTRLTVLVIHRHDVDEDALTLEQGVVDQNIAPLTSLQRLSLPYLHRVSDAALIPLVHLTHLEIGGNPRMGISDAGISHLVHLVYLRLGSAVNSDSISHNNRVTDAGLSALVNLTYLDMRTDVQITDAGLSPLTELRFLNVGANALITVAGISHLKRLRILSSESNWSKLDHSQFSEQFPHSLLGNQWIFDRVTQGMFYTDREPPLPAEEPRVVHLAAPHLQSPPSRSALRVVMSLRADNLVGGRTEYAPYAKTWSTWGTGRMARTVPTVLTERTWSPEILITLPALSVAAARGDEAVWVKLMTHTRRSGIKEIDEAEQADIARTMQSGVARVSLAELFEKDAIEVEFIDLASIQAAYRLRAHKDEAGAKAALAAAVKGHLRVRWHERPAPTHFDAATYQALAARKSFVNEEGKTVLVYNESALPRYQQTVESLLEFYVEHFIGDPQKNIAPLYKAASPVLAGLHLALYQSEQGVLPVTAYWQYDVMARHYASEVERQRTIALYAVNETYFSDILRGCVRRAGLSARQYTSTIHRQLNQSPDSDTLLTSFRACLAATVQIGTHLANSANYKSDVRWTRPDGAPLMVEDFSPTLVAGLGNADDCEGMSHASSTILRAIRGRVDEWQDPLLIAAAQLLNEGMIFDIAATVTSAYVSKDQTVLTKDKMTDLPLINGAIDARAQVGGHCYAIFKFKGPVLAYLKNGNATPAQYARLADVRHPRWHFKNLALVLEGTGPINPFLLSTEETAGSKDTAGYRLAHNVRVARKALQSTCPKLSSEFHGQGLPFYNTMPKDAMARRASSFYRAVAHVSSQELYEEVSHGLGQCAVVNPATRRWGVPISHLLRDDSPEHLTKVGFVAPYANETERWDREIIPVMETVQNQMPISALGLWDEESGVVGMPVAAGLFAAHETHLALKATEAIGAAYLDQSQIRAFAAHPRLQDAVHALHDPEALLDFKLVEYQYDGPVTDVQMLVALSQDKRARDDISTHPTLDRLLNKLVARDPSYFPLMHLQACDIDPVRPVATFTLVPSTGGGPPAATGTVIGLIHTQMAGRPVAHVPLVAYAITARGNHASVTPLQAGNVVITAEVAPSPTRTLVAPLAHLVTPAVAHGDLPLGLLHVLRRVFDPYHYHGYRYDPYHWDRYSPYYHHRGRGRRRHRIPGRHRGHPGGRRGRGRRMLGGPVSVTVAPAEVSPSSYRTFVVPLFARKFNLAHLKRGHSYTSEIEALQAQFPTHRLDAQIYVSQPLPSAEPLVELHLVFTPLATAK